MGEGQRRRRERSRSTRPGSGRRPDPQAPGGPSEDSPTSANASPPPVLEAWSFHDQRLSTGFNFYSQWWTVWLMNDLQSYILRIIKARAEKAA